MITFRLGKIKVFNLTKYVVCGYIVSLGSEIGLLIHLNIHLSYFILYSVFVNKCNLFVTPPPKKYKTKHDYVIFDHKLKNNN